MGTVGLVHHTLHNDNQLNFRFEVEAVTVLDSPFGHILICIVTVVNRFYSFSCVCDCMWCSLPWCIVVKWNHVC